jgi:pimeloyl-ACP methyl ester carboxylesterase
MKTLIMGILTAVAALLVTNPISVAQAKDRCQQYTVPVTLTADNPTLYNVVGVLCDDNHHIIQLLLSGATYGHIYWDLPYQPQRYSYVGYASHAGYATFNIDRLGIGLSDHPADSRTVNIPSEAYVTHQIVQQLRSGAVNGISYERVILVGHSLGSVISLVEAANFSDVDGVIASGFLHFVNPVALQALLNAFYPAILDPRFSGSGLAPGYLTTPQGFRPGIYDFIDNWADADPAVIALDESTKETTTDGEVDSLLALAASPDFLTFALSIKVPVLIALGQYDGMTACSVDVGGCNSASVVAEEKGFFAKEACLQASVIPNAGHVINMQKNARDWFAIAADWADDYVRSNSGHCGP